MFFPFDIERDDGVQDRQRFSIFVWSVMACCIGVHLILFVVQPETVRIDTFYRLGACRFRFAWWSPVTCVLVHGSWMHLLGNMYFLWLYGPPLEKRVGSPGFSVLFLSGAFVSVGAHVLTVSPLFADEPAIGASGAISTLLGAFLVLWPTARLRCLLFPLVSLRPIMVQVPAYIVLGVWLAAQLVYTLKLVGDVAGVAFWAHVAGFAWGAALAHVMQMRWANTENRREAAARAPLLAAWRAWNEGAGEGLVRHCRDLDVAAIDDMCGASRFALGLAALQAGDSVEGGECLLLGLEQARDYRCHAGVLNAYLQLDRHFEAAGIPWSIHRDAAFAAVALRQDNLALKAFDRALAGGCTEGLDLIERAVRGAAARCVAFAMPDLPAGRGTAAGDA